MILSGLCNTNINNLQENNPSNFVGCIVECGSLIKPITAPILSEGHKGVSLGTYWKTKVHEYIWA